MHSVVWLFSHNYCTQSVTTNLLSQLNEVIWTSKVAHDVQLYFSSGPRCWLSLQLPFGAKCSIRHVLGLIIPYATGTDHRAAGRTSSDSVHALAPSLVPRVLCECQALIWEDVSSVGKISQAIRRGWGLSSRPGRWTQHNDDHYMMCKCISLSEMHVIVLLCLDDL